MSGRRSVCNITPDTRAYHNLSLDRHFFTFQNMAPYELLFQAHNYLTHELFRSILRLYSECRNERQDQTLSLLENICCVCFDRR